MPDRPNILFIFPDQLSARWMGCYGNDIVQTPCLDRFATKAVKFDRAYTNVPLCTPFRGCLLTGKYPSQTGITENGDCLPDGCKTLADFLNDAGYDTHYIGKWHISGEPHALRAVPPNKRGGFKSFIGWESHHVDHYDGLIWTDDQTEPVKLPGHETDGLTDIVCSELQALASSDSPFFMAVSYQAPHAPCTPPNEYLKKYDSSVLDGPDNTDRDAWFRKPGWNADYGIEEFRKRYFGEISHLDAAMGRVLDALEATGLAENTIVIFTSDHGEMCGCHGRFGKGLMFDEAVRVPLLLRVPGINDADAIERPVSSIDLLPTILDFAGIDIPETAEGISFAPELTDGPTSSPPADVFIEHRQDCIIRRHLKLVTNRDSNEVTHLFDLERDPFELDNLAGKIDPAFQDDMLRSLNEWRDRIRRVRGEPAS